MQRLRSSTALKVLRNLPLAAAVSPLPGFEQLAVPCVHTLLGSLPSINSAPTVTSFTNLRGFAAEACRVDDQQAAAEALFKNAGNFAAPLQQSTAYPFFARAYYVGTLDRQSNLASCCL